MDRLNVAILVATIEMVQHGKNAMSIMETVKCVVLIAYLAVSIFNI